MHKEVHPQSTISYILTRFPNINTNIVNLVEGGCIWSLTWSYDFTLWLSDPPLPTWRVALKPTINPADPLWHMIWTWVTQHRFFRHGWYLLEEWKHLLKGFPFSSWAISKKLLKRIHWLHTHLFLIGISTWNPWWLNWSKITKRLSCCSFSILQHIRNKSLKK